MTSPATVCVRCGNVIPSWLIHATEDCIPRRGTCPRCGQRWTDHGGTEDPICRDPREVGVRISDCTHCAMPDAECWANRGLRNGFCCPRCDHPRSTFGKVYPDA